MNRIKIVVLFIVSLLLFSNIWAQDQSALFEIKYVGQYPKENVKEKKEKNWLQKLLPDNSFKKNWFSDILFGKSAPDLERPISVIGFSPDSMFIFDQGTGILFNVKNNVGEITQFKNHKGTIFPSLVGSCLFTTNKFLFTDSKLNKLFVYNRVTKKLNVLNDTLHLSNPTGVAYSTKNQTIWITETKKHRILVLNKNGEIIKKIGVRGVENGQFNYPTFIWIDNLGTVYVIDTMNFRIQLFDENGNFISKFGEAGNSSGNFARPKGIATDSFGNIYIADALFHNIQVFNKEGRLLTIIGKRGNKSKEFILPVGIYIDKNNFIYVADSYNKRIQIYKVIKELDAN